MGTRWKVERYEDSLEMSAQEASTATAARKIMLAAVERMAAGNSQAGSIINIASGMSLRSLISESDATYFVRLSDKTYVRVVAVRD